MNTQHVYNPKGAVGPSYGAYITYSEPREAALAILSADEFTLERRLLRASFGTTKYCSFFLKDQKCVNKECLYLHELHPMNETFTKEQMASREMFDKQQAIAINLSKIDEIDMNQFIGTCDHFDPNDKLDY